MIIFLILLLAIFALLTWRNLETGILLICALLPSYLIRFSILGIPTTFLEAMTLIVIVVWGVHQINAIRTGGSRPTPAQHDRKIIMAIILLLVAATIGIFVSPDKHAAIGVWKAFYVEPILMFFVIRDVLETSPLREPEGSSEPRTANPSFVGGALQGASLDSSPAKGRLGGVSRIFRALGVSAFLISLFGLIQYFFSIGIPAPWDLEHRITSIFEYPNALALFLEPIIVISWFEIKRISKENTGNEKKTKEIAFWLLVSLLSTINIFLAQSEAGIAALLITAICILLFLKTTRRQTLVSILLIGTLIFTIPISRDYLVEKFTFKDFSEQVRLSQWKETTQLLKDHPVFGVGLSGYPIVMKRYHNDLAFEIFQYPHNILLNIWVELGLLGLIAVSLLAIRLGCIAHAEDRAHPLQSQAILFGAIFFEIILHGLVDVPYFKNDLAMMTWILIACMITMYPCKVKR